MGGIGVSVGINFSYRIMEVCTTDNSQCRISISSTPSFGGARSSRIPSSVVGDFPHNKMIARSGTRRTTKNYRAIRADT